LAPVGRYLAGHECQRRKLGYGRWVILEKAAGGIIGFGGLYDDPFDVGWEIEVSYTFTVTARGNGDATELAQVLSSISRTNVSGSLSSRRSPILTMPPPERGLEKASFAPQGFPELNRYLYVHRNTR